MFAELSAWFPTQNQCSMYLSCLYSLLQRIKASEIKCSAQAYTSGVQEFLDMRSKKASPEGVPVFLYVWKDCQLKKAAWLRSSFHRASYPHISLTFSIKICSFLLKLWHEKSSEFVLYLIGCSLQAHGHLNKPNHCSTHVFPLDIPWSWTIVSWKRHWASRN